MVFATVAKRLPLPLSFKVNGRVIRAALISEEQDNFVSEKLGEPGGIRTRTDEREIAFGTLAAEITPTTNGFFANDEYDLDNPTAGFSSIPEALEEIREGKVSWGVNAMGVFTVGMIR